MATVESVLLYGSETWTLTQTMEKQLNGCYTRMLRMAFNISYKDHVTNEDLYGNLPQVTSKIMMRRMRLAGHCWRHKEEIASSLVLWEPQDGIRSRGQQKTTFIDRLLLDSGLDNTRELGTLMEDRKQWKKVVACAGRPDGRPR